MATGSGNSAGPGIVLSLVAASLMTCACMLAIPTQTDDVADIVAENERLTAENARLRALLISGSQAGSPKKRDRVVPSVEGLVLNTKTTRSSELVEISIGSDDGLAEKDTLFIHRTNGNKDLGRIRLVLVTPDRAVGIVTTRPDNERIRQGDTVTTTKL